MSLELEPCIHVSCRCMTYICMFSLLFSFMSVCVFVWCMCVCVVAAGDDSGIEHANSADRQSRHSGHPLTVEAGEHTDMHTDMHHIYMHTYTTYAHTSHFSPIYAHVKCFLLLFFSFFIFIFLLCLLYF